MTTLRDRVRSALGRTEPTPEQASADLERILARTRRPRRLTSPIYVLVIVATVAVFVFGWQRFSPKPSSPPSLPLAAGDGVHLYIHVTGEPDDKALALDLSSTGAR